MQPGPAPLPALRQDLRILPGAPLASGAPGWVAFDPVRHRYFQIGRTVLELLGEWAPGAPAALAARMQARFGRQPSPGEMIRAPVSRRARAGRKRYGRAQARRPRKGARASLACRAGAQLPVLPHPPRPPASVPDADARRRGCAVLARHAGFRRSVRAPRPSAGRPAVGPLRRHRPPSAEPGRCVRIRGLSSGRENAARARPRLDGDPLRGAGAHHGRSVHGAGSVPLFRRDGRVAAAIAPAAPRH